MNSLQLSIQTALPSFDLFSDSRSHGYAGPTRNVRIARVTPNGGGCISKSEDGVRCAVTGNESLRILRVSDPSKVEGNPEHKSSVGRGGHRIDASRNFWEGSGLKIDSASTDVAWGHGLFSNKILTSARNGELIMWDLNKSGATKYERRVKDHLRSIHALSVSHVVRHYCITGSAEGDLRVWDLREFNKSIMRIHFPTSVRSVVFSPSSSQPLHAVLGLDNGSIYRWDLQMGQRGQLDRLPVAHAGSVTSLDWCPPSGDGAAVGDMPNGGLGWIVSGSMDRSVKVWNLNTSTSHIPHKPTYSLHPSFPVRRVLWRGAPYHCELAVVSNAEFGNGSLSDLSGGNLNAGGGTGGLTRPSSGIGLDTLANGGKGKDTKSPSPSPSGGNTVEIWDVRRGWLAKWSVCGSSEGGVTDIAFRDSHAIWAQHPSGTFSQIDLRDARRSIDAIPRVGATWEASGSLAFVADRQTKWEVPYDDIRPEKRPPDIKSKFLKALGDEPCMPGFQNLGNYVPSDAPQRLEAFTKLASMYVFEGEDRRTLCALNAQSAMEIGNIRAAQTWLLLGASLTVLIPGVPPTPPRSPLVTGGSSIPPSASAPAGITADYTFPPASTTRTSESSLSGMLKRSPGRSSSRPGPPQYRSSSSASRKLTPTSSNSSSPRHLPSPLPPSTTPRPPFLGRRESADSGNSRRSSVYRRLSMSAPGTSSAGLSVNASLRHVGEGALDDSDSSSSSEGDASDEVEDVMAIGGGGGASSDEDNRPGTHIISPTLGPVRITPAHPSPLSRVAGQQHWTEDEDGGENDDASSPSPMSTDTESGGEGSDSPRRRPTSKSGRSATRRSSTRIKSRSRSSTVASLAAPTSLSLTRQESHSSIRTVTAGDVSFRDQEDGGVNPLKVEETIKDIRFAHQRQKSQAVSEFVLDQTQEVEDEVEKSESADLSALTERRMEIVFAEEKRLRELAWDGLQEALESFLEEGDIQICAMLALIVPRELGLQKKQISRFLDAYIDLLTRLRLYTCAASIRKFCQEEGIRNLTLLETTIHTMCRKCRKPLTLPAGTQTLEQASKGAYSYCSTCKSSVVICSICRLPVRALLFQCSVCNHGGHQACYRRYYMQRPMTELPALFLPSASELRGRSITRGLSPALGDDGSSPFGGFDHQAEHSPVHQTRKVAKLMGHPCAAGCGHYCWAVSGSSDTP